ATPDGVDRARVVLAEEQPDLVVAVGHLEVPVHLAAGGGVGARQRPEHVFGNPGRQVRPAGSDVVAGLAVVRVVHVLGVVLRGERDACDRVGEHVRIGLGRTVAHRQPVRTAVVRRYHHTAAGTRADPIQRCTGGEGSGDGDVDGDVGGAAVAVVGLDGDGVGAGVAGVRGDVEGVARQGREAAGVEGRDRQVDGVAVGVVGAGRHLGVVAFFQRQLA